MTTLELLQKAKQASRSLAMAGTDTKNRALLAMADSLVAAVSEILAANQADLDAARGTVPDVMLDRLALTRQRIADMAEGIRQVAALPDPVGRVLRSHTLDNGLLVEKIAVSMGVVAIIYESRPNVRGGKEAFRSNQAVVEALRRGLQGQGLDPDWVSLVQDTSRDSARQLMTASGLVDLLIPRGGAGLIRSCVENATVPCIQTGTGICHIYVDAAADQEKALNILENAKTSRPSVCNAAEVCLVHKDIAAEFLPRLRHRLVDQREEKGVAPVQLRLDERAAAIIPGQPAGEKDFDTEFLDYILAVAVVDSVQQAVEHIARHSTGHSEAIVTADQKAAAYFTAAVDSAAVYVNASTRFTDGGQFGLGCEMGISTQKLHARGPMGLEELTSYKYVVRGDGQIR